MWLGLRPCEYFEKNVPFFDSESLLSTKQHRVCRFIRRVEGADKRHTNLRHCLYKRNNNKSNDRAQLKGRPSLRDGLTSGVGAVPFTRTPSVKPVSVVHRQVGGGRQRLGTKETTQTKEEPREGDSHTPNDSMSCGRHSSVFTRVLTRRTTYE